MNICSDIEKRTYLSVHSILWLLYPPNSSGGAWVEFPEETQSGGGSEKNGTDTGGQQQSGNKVLFLRDGKHACGQRENEAAAGGV